MSFDNSFGDYLWIIYLSADWVSQTHVYIVENTYGIDKITYSRSAQQPNSKNLKVQGLNPENEGNRKL